MATERIEFVFIERGASGVQRTLQNIGQAGRSLGQAQDAAQGFSKILSAAQGIVAAFTFKNLIEQGLKLVDIYQRMQQRIQTVTTGHAQLEVVTDKLADIAVRTRQGFESVVETYQRAANATKTLGLSQNEVLKITENLNKAAALSGASGAEAKRGLIQFSQGLAANTLQGRDLRSVLEQVPVLADVIADHFTKTSGKIVTAFQLKGIAAQGKLAAKDLAQALLEPNARLDKFIQLVPTLSQGFESLRTRVIQFAGAFDKSTGLAQGLGRVMLALADNLDTVARSVVALAIAVGTVLAYQAFGALFAVVAANPFAALALAAVAATAAAITFSDQINVSSDGFVSLASVGQAAYKRLTDGFKAFTDDSKSLLDKWIDGLKMEINFIPDLFASAYKAVKNFILDQNQSFTDIARGAAPPSAADSADSPLMAEARRIEQDKTNLAAIQKADRDKAEADLDKKGKAIPAPPPIVKRKAKTFQDYLNELDHDIAEFTQLNDRLREQQKKANDIQDALRRGTLSANQRGQVTNRVAEIQALRDQAQAYQEIVGPAETMQNKVEALNQLFLKGAISLEQYNGKIQEIFRAFRTNTFAGQLDILQELGITTAQTAQNQELYNKQIQIESDIHRQLTAAEREQLAVQLESNRRYEAYGQALAQISQPQNDYIVQTQALLGVLHDQPGTLLAVADAMTKVEIAYLQALPATNSFGAEFERQQRIMSLQSQNVFGDLGAEAAKTFGPGGTLTQGISDVIAQTVIMKKNFLQAIKEMADSILTQLVSALVRAVLTQGLLAIVGGGAPVALPGGGGGKSLASGGYTGDTGTRTPAGIVHGQEYVVNAAATKRHRGLLEAINSGARPSGGGVNVTINNQAGGVEFETNALGPNEVEIIARRVVSQHAPAAVAGDMENPNGRVSRALTRNLQSGRRRY